MFTKKFKEKKNPYVYCYFTFRLFKKMEILGIRTNEDLLVVRRTGFDLKSMQKMVIIK